MGTFAAPRCFVEEHTIMISKRIIALVLFTAFAAAPSGLHGQWKPLGPYGGPVECFASIGTNIFAGGAHGGVFRSTDSGTSWAAENTGLSGSDVRALAVTGTSIWAGTDNGIYVSTDSGSNWINSGLTNNQVTSLAVVGANIFAGTERNGIFLSTNNGSKWLAASGGIPYDTIFGVSTITAIVAIGSYLFAGTGVGFSGSGDGVFLSTNSGEQWTSVGLSSRSISAFAKIGTRLFVGTDESIFLSGDSGKKWSSVDSGLPSNASVYGLASFGSNLFAGMSNNTFRSTDNGMSWQEVSNGLTNSGDLFAFTMIGANLLTGSDGGIFLSVDSGMNWHVANSGLTNTGRVLTLAMNGTNLFAGIENSVFLATDSGRSWIVTDSGLPNAQVDVLAVSGSNILAGTDGYGVFRSTNNGASWSSSNKGLITSGDAYVVESFAVRGAELFAGTYGYGVFHSSDTGVNWTSGGVQWAAVLSLAFMGGELFAGSDAGIFRSTDNDSSWKAVYGGYTSGPTCTSLGAIGTYLFAGFENDGIFLTTNDGGDWSRRDSGLGDHLTVRTFAVVGTKIFAATPSGVFLSTDSGLSWNSVNAGLTQLDVQSLYLSGNDLIAGTFLAGVWRRSLSEMISPPSAVAEAQPSKQDIRSYPNPFSQSTEIAFVTEAAGYADVSVMNLLGAEVAHLFSGTLGAGEHSFAWNPTGLPDGAYECLVRLNGQVEKLPMMLMR